MKLAAIKANAIGHRNVAQAIEVISQSDAVHSCRLKKSVGGTLKNVSADEITYSDDAVILINFNTDEPNEINEQIFSFGRRFESVNWEKPERVTFHKTPKELIEGALKSYSIESGTSLTSIRIEESEDRVHLIVEPTFAHHLIGIGMHIGKLSQNQNQQHQSSGK